MRRVLFAILLSLCAATPAVRAEDAPKPRVPFPELTLVTADGNVQTVADFKGAVTVINFWATWCGPCREELPELQKVYNDLAGKGFMVAAINVDGPRVPRKLVSAFMVKMGISLPVFFIDPADELALGINSIPFSVLLDRQGRVVRAYPGYSPAAIKNLRETAEELLKEKSTETHAAASPARG